MRLEDIIMNRFSKKQKIIIVIVLVFTILIGYSLSFIPVFNNRAERYQEDLLKAKSDLKTGVRDLGFGDEDENDIVNQLDSWMSLSQKTKALAALDYFDYKELGLKSYEDWVTLQVLISHTLVVENKLIEYRGIDEEKFELLHLLAI